MYRTGQTKADKFARYSVTAALNFARLEYTSLV